MNRWLTAGLLAGLVGVAFMGCTYTDVAGAKAKEAFDSLFGKLELQEAAAVRQLAALKTATETLQVEKYKYEAQLKRLNEKLEPLDTAVSRIQLAMTKVKQQADGLTDGTQVSFGGKTYDKAGLQALAGQLVKEYGEAKKARDSVAGAKPGVQKFIDTFSSRSAELKKKYDEYAAQLEKIRSNKKELVALQNAAQTISSTDATLGESLKTFEENLDSLGAEVDAGLAREQAMFDELAATSKAASAADAVLSGVDTASPPDNLAEIDAILKGGN
jgi:chromosome segregation ATPase